MPPTGVSGVPNPGPRTPRPTRPARPTSRPPKSEGPATVPVPTARRPDTDLPTSDKHALPVARGAVALDPLLAGASSVADVERRYWVQVKYLVVSLSALTGVAGLLYAWLAPTALNVGRTVAVCGVLLAASVLFLFVPTVLPGPDGKRPVIYGVWTSALAVVSALLAQLDQALLSPFIIVFAIAIVLAGAAASRGYVILTGVIALTGYVWLQDASGVDIGWSSLLAASMLVLVLVAAVWVAATQENRARLLAIMTDHLAEQMATVQWVIDSSPAGICISDAADRIVSVNSAACEMDGRSADELIGAPAHETFHPVHRDGSPFSKEDCDAQSALRSGVEHPLTEDVYIRADGTPYDVEANAVPTPDGGVMVAFFDVTERLATQRLKDEFVSVISHELRTPLTSVRGALGLMAAGVAGELQPDVAKMVAIAAANTDRLSRLINDILDVERIKSGPAELHPVTFETSTVACAAVDEMRPMATAQGVELRCEGETVTVSADFDRVHQVVVNLLSNAIKFSAPGSEVVVTTAVDGPDARIDVRDHGRGIPGEMREQIFDRFQQVDASDSRVMDGVGLGLAICDGIVRQHGGRIWVDSTVGIGSTFSFTLPRATMVTLGTGDRQEQPALAADRRHRTGASGPAVLIVEDDVDLTEVMAAGLRDRGVEVAITGSWTAARESCEDEMPDVILLDLILPDGTGADLVAWLQETGRRDAVAVVVYTALDVDSWHRIEMGVSKQDLFVKSQAAPEVVVNRVLRLLDGTKPDRTVAPT